MSRRAPLPSHSDLPVFGVPCDRSRIFDSHSITCTGTFWMSIGQAGHLKLEMFCTVQLYELFDLNKLVLTKLDVNEF